MLFGIAHAAGGSTDPVMTAMDAEIDRAMAGMPLGEHAGPWRVSIEVTEVLHRSSASAEFGALTGSTTGTLAPRNAVIDVRVGSAEQDNTHFVAPYGAKSGLVQIWNGRTSLPAGDHVPALRRALWLALDAEYKTAVETLARKQAAGEGRGGGTDLPDWTPHAAPARAVKAPIEFAGRPLEDLEELVRAVTEVCAGVSGLLQCSAKVDQSHWRQRYVDTDGNRADWETGGQEVTVSLGAQAPDGLPLFDVVSIGPTPTAELPDVRALTARVGERARALVKRRTADLARRYEGPVLFEGAAAAALVGQTLAPQLVATRKPDVDPTAFREPDIVESPLQHRVGRLVLPDFLSVADQPSLTSWSGWVFVPSPALDREGTPVRDITLVQNGSLKRLLGTRAPARGLQSPTGHARAGADAAYRLVVTSRKGKSDKALRKLLSQQVAAEGLEYGIVVTRLAPRGSKPRDSSMVRFSSEPTAALGVNTVVEAYALYGDGRLVPLRGVELPDVPTSAYRRILAAGRDGTAVAEGLGRPSRFGQNAGMGEVVAPSLLFEELMVLPPEGPHPRPIVMSPPE